MRNEYAYTGMDELLAGSFRAAVYCRLSKDDDLDGESASISNQRDMLEGYCEKQAFSVRPTRASSSMAFFWASSLETLFTWVGA